MPDSGLAHIPVIWHQLVTGGGGLVTGVDIAADGTKVCRTDVGGDYVFNTATSKWVQMKTQIKAPITTLDGYRQMVGVADTVICASDSNRIYSIYKNDVWVSTDKGLTSTATAFTANATTDGSAEYFGANSSNYKYINKLAVDPNNADVVYCPYPGGVAKYTVDGGTTWNDVPDLPAGTGFGAACFTFDPSSGTTGGKTNTIWCTVHGEGVWRSTDAGANWAVVDAAVGTTINAYTNSAISSDGVFYLVWDNLTTRVLSRYQAGSFSTIATNANAIRVVTHPVTAGVVCYILSLSMVFYYSSDYGGSFNTHSKASQTWASTDAPWQAANINAGFGGSISRLKFDPNDANKLWMTGGQGIWSATISAGVAPSWQTTVLGIEELVSNDIWHESGTDVFHTVWDESCFKHSPAAPSTAPSLPIWGASSVLKLSGTFSIDPANTQQMVIGGTSTCSGYSTDGGTTWTLFPSIPAGVPTTYSNICINNGVIIWMGQDSDQGYPWRSDDWGTTWVALDDIANIPGTGNTGWSITHALTRHTVCADRVNPNKFYMYNYLSGLTPDIRGVYISTDAGLTWTLQSNPGPEAVFDTRDMKCVPGVEGHLFATCGHNTSATHPTDSPFRVSTDGGVTWSNVNALVKEVQKFGFGKAMTGSANPTLFIQGFYNSIFGIYRSSDLGATWVQYWSTEHGSWPLGLGDAVTCMDGDKDIEGRVYLGFGGNGAAYADVTSTPGMRFGLQF